MAVALIQEFPVDPSGDRTTTNYDAVQARLDVRGNPPAGGIVQTAGFDEEAGVFRIFAVWETREQAERFIEERVTPIVEELTAGREGAGPPQRQSFYELHDLIVGGS
jgi:hypothetical protein